MCVDDDPQPTEPLPRIATAGAGCAVALEVLLVAAVAAAAFLAR